MPDIARLQNAVSRFAFYNKPSNGDYSAPCTVGDINRVIDGVSKVLQVFIDELSQIDSEDK